MVKKTTLFIFCFITSVFIKAQITAYHYPTGNLTEEKINLLLENSRKNGVQEWEVQKQNNFLHARLIEQNNVTNYNQKNIVSPPQVNSTACVNAGFENGTNSNWNFYSGSVSSLSGVNLPCNSCANTPGAISNIVNSTSTISGQCTLGMDIYGNFPVVAPSPFGGNYSLLLNDETANSKIQKTSYSFVVTNSINIFTFQYAVVLQSGGHLPNEQPYFHIDVTDTTTGNIIPCTQYDISAPSSGVAPNWYVSTLDNTVSYRPWTSVSIDLQSLIGHVVTVNLIVSDCIYGGHFGYCYLDAACGNINFLNSISLPGICDTTGSVTISAPPGYINYQWYGPNNDTAIAGANSQTLTITANKNDTFLVKAGSQFGCPASFEYVITSSSVNIYSSTDTINPGDTVVLAATGAISYTWTSSDGATYTGDSISVFPFASTTYTVIGSDSSGCKDSATMRILVVNTTDINKFLVNDNTKIYPNPANESLTITSKYKNAEVFLYDVLGNKIKQLTLENETTTIDISSLSKGVYFLNLQTTNTITTKKIIVQR